MHRLLLLCCLILWLSAIGMAQNATDSTRLLSRDLDTAKIDVYPHTENGTDTARRATDDNSDADDADTDDEKAVNYFIPIDMQDREQRDAKSARVLTDSARKALEKDPSFWYANHDFASKDKPREHPPDDDPTPLSEKPAFQAILWVVAVAGFIVFLLMYLSNSNAGIFRRSRRLTGENEETEHEDIFSINYQKEIEAATAEGKFRLAVRLLFLRQLKELADRQLILYKQDRTNFDYLVQLQPTGMQSDFARLSTNYEYIWYGQFDIDREKFVLIRKEFENFERKLR